MSRSRDLADAGVKADYLDNVASDINTQLTAKAPIASPDFTGTVDLTGTTLSLDNDQISGDKISGGTIGAGTFSGTIGTSATLSFELITFVKADGGSAETISYDLTGDPDGYYVGYSAILRLIEDNLGYGSPCLQNVTKSGSSISLGTLLGSTHVGGNWTVSGTTLTFGGVGAVDMPSFLLFKVPSAIS